MAGRGVLTVNRVGFLGGVERVLVTLAAGLPDCGYHPTLLCPDEGALAAAARAEGIAVATFPLDRMRITADPRVLARYPLGWWCGARQVLRAAERTRARLIHVHHPVGALYAIPAARRLGLPLVLHVHEVLPAKPMYAWALRLAVRRAARILCVSDSARALLSVTSADPARVQVIHNGLDRRFLAGGITPAPEVSGPGPHIGVFGVIEPRKGQDVFLAAAAALARRYPAAQFWIVGPLALADKAGFRVRLEALAAQPGLAGRVHFTGFRPDVARWMLAMDVVALPSVGQESFGMVLAEALALGRKVVASATGGTAEAIADGVTGRLVPPGDAAALAAAVAGLLEADAEGTGARAAAATRARFAPELFCRRVAAVYDELLAG